MSKIAAKQDPPQVAFLTDEPGSNGFARKARALAGAFEELGVRFDAVYIKGGQRVSEQGVSREIGLGHIRAALCTPALVGYLRRERPRLALVNSGQMGPAAVLAGALARRPVVPWEPAFIERDLEHLPARMRLMARLQDAVYRRAPAVVAPSSDMVAWVPGRRRIEPGRVHLLPNPVDGDAVRAAAGVEALASDRPFRVCAVGRLVAQKGYDVLIEALASVRGRLPSPWVLTIAGEEGVWRGGWASRIEAQARRAGIGDNVELVGPLDNPHALMRDSDLFVHAARWEPFGLVLVEALALGVPIVATDCPGGPREILDGGRFGVLVPPGDPPALGTAVADLAVDGGRRRDLAAVGPAAAERYAPRVIAERILELGERIAGEPLRR